MQDDETGRDDDGRPVGASSEPPDVVGFGPPDEAGSGPSRHRRRRVAVYGVMALLAVGLGGAAIAGLTSHPGTPPTGVSSHQVPGPHNDVSGGGSLRTSAVAAKVDPGVVDIDALIAYSGGTSSEGTGMVISRNGLVLTNNHVINGSNSIHVRAAVASGSREYTATVVGYDATHDVALLKITAPNLQPVSVGNSDQVKLGTPVLALGNAEGQGGLPRAAAGLVNSLNKTIDPTDESTGATETLHNMLQTTADIVSGDSGGPLANGAGQVIGMTTANASSSQGSSSVLGYAIPINTALDVAHQIAAGQRSGTVAIGLPGFLGVLVPQSNSSSPQQQAAQQRQQERQQSGPGSGSGGGIGSSGSGQRASGCVLDNSDTSVPASIAPVSRGVLVDGVLCGTAAGAAGLVSGDVITSVNGQAVTSPTALTQSVSGLRPGTKVTLDWETAAGESQTRTVALGAAPAR
ncbi:MAG TPA: trypsin-like peptidase domain-containing protein [Streptosporangiaceae bacterium]|jgi:S1-C subfamily serine protease